jgi:hypothetical protein
LAPLSSAKNQLHISRALFSSQDQAQSYAIPLQHFPFAETTPMPFQTYVLRYSKMNNEYPTRYRLL